MPRAVALGTARLPAGDEMSDRCIFCRWQPSGAIDLYCIYHWAKLEIADKKCGCGAAAVWVQKRRPLCAAHGGVFPVAAPGPYRNAR